MRPARRVGARVDRAGLGGVRDAAARSGAGRGGVSAGLHAGVLRGGRRMAGRADHPPNPPRPARGDARPDPTGRPGPRREPTVPPARHRHAHRRADGRTLSLGRGCRASRISAGLDVPGRPPRGGLPPDPHGPRRLHRAPHHAGPQPRRPRPAGPADPAPRRALTDSADSPTIFDSRFPRNRMPHHDRSP